MSTRNVHDAHIDVQIGELHRAVLEIVSTMNRPQQDDELLREAGVSLDRALFPLLVGIAKYGPVGVVDLADRVGRDYTTISRQLAKLENLGLIERRNSAADKRVREAIVTAKGEAMSERVDTARTRLGRAVFATWERQDFDDLVRLMTRFAEAIREVPGAGAKDSP